MLKISKLADYAVVVMDHLAKKKDLRLSANTIAGETHLKVPVVSKVLKLLLKAGLLSSEQGFHGGYQLTRSPDLINVAQIVSAVDGQTAVTQCGEGENICDHDRHCALKNHWRWINQVVVNVLENLTLADMGRSLEQQPIQFYRQKKLVMKVGETHECK